MLRTAIALGVGVLLAGGTVIAQQAQTPAQAQPGKVASPNFMAGKVVRVDPATNKIWIRTGPGTAAREQAFMVDRNAKFFGADAKALENGLRAEQFRAGADVRFLLGQGVNPSISEFRFGPAGTTNTPGTGGKAGAGRSGGAGAGTGGGP
jgi:hypothetical protein